MFAPSKIVIGTLIALVAFICIVLFTMPVLFATPETPASLSDINLKSPNKLFWVHIQKTSSWMGDFLLLWACPDLIGDYEDHSDSAESVFFYDWVSTEWASLPMHCKKTFYSAGAPYGYHVPYKHEHNALKGAAVTLFRKPVDRVISAFLFGRKGMMLPSGSPWKMGDLKNSVRDAINSSNVPIDTYARLPGIAGCQTKMVLGKECGQVYSLMRDEIALAKEHLSSLEHFAFIGLTEEPTASSQLFIAMYGEHYKYPHMQIDLANLTKRLVFAYEKIRGRSYRKNSRASNVTKAKLAYQLDQTGWTDDADEQIYQQAADVFYRRCKEYRIDTLARKARYFKHDQ